MAHLTAKREQQTAKREHRIDGAEIYVIDDLLGARAHREVTRALHNMPFRKVEADREGTRMRGFVADFAIEAIEDDPLVHAILSRVASSFPRETFAVTRTYCNSNVYGDMSYPHRDASPKRRSDLTALYYANERWEQEWGGETIFYDATGDAVVCVTPKPNRLVLFRGWIEHRNGIPSRECYAPRLSFVLKLRARARGAAPGISRR
jgi:SM-20-related protein